MRKVEIQVLGFAFNESKNSLVLIRKDKPKQHKGLLNGIGGKVEKDDHYSYNTIVREFKEETGVNTKIDDWKYFGEILINEFSIKLFVMFNDDIQFCKTTEKEEILILKENTTIELINTINNRKDIVSDLKELIPLALSKNFKRIFLEV